MIARSQAHISYTGIYHEFYLHRLSRGRGSHAYMHAACAKSVHDTATREKKKERKREVLSVDG